MSALTLFLLLSCAAAGSTANTGDVVSLTSNDFHRTVKEGLWLVEFMAPWCTYHHLLPRSTAGCRCGHCQALKPIYAEAATALKGKIGFAAVDATGAYINIPVGSKAHCEWQRRMRYGRSTE